MKTTLKEFRRLALEEFRRMLSEGDVDSERRRNYGYDEADSGQGVEYHDLPEGLDLEEDSDRLRRAADGYGETEFDEGLEEQPEDIFGDTGPWPPAKNLPKKMTSPSSALGRKGQEYQKAAEPANIQNKGRELVNILMSQISDPTVYKAFVTALRKEYPDHPLASKLPANLGPAKAPAAPSESKEEEEEGEDKKKRVKAKSHAAPSDSDIDFPGPPAAEGFDPVSGRCPQSSEPFDKAMHVPVHNMSDPEDASDVPLFGEIEETLKEIEIGGDPWDEPDEDIPEDDPYRHRGETPASSGTGFQGGRVKPSLSGRRGTHPGLSGRLGRVPNGPPPGWANPERDEAIDIPSLSRVSEKEFPSPCKAKKMLKDKEVHGKPLTKKQKGLFGMIAGGEEPTKTKE